MQSQTISNSNHQSTTATTRNKFNVPGDPTAGKVAGLAIGVFLFLLSIILWGAGAGTHTAALASVGKALFGTGLALTAISIVAICRGN